MKLSAILTGTLLAGAAVFAAPNAWAIDSKAFLTQAIQGNLAEISVGQLAQQKGGSDAVKKLGATLVSDHTTANQNAMAAAQVLGVTPPAMPTDDQKQMHDKLAGESGAAFDHDFLNGMLADHKKDAADYQDVMDNNKDAAGQYASKTLPAIQQHMATIQMLADNTSASATPTSGTSAAAAAGANSFTEGQAQARIQDAGFTSVSALKKDDQGVWRGTGSKDGQTMPVALDFKGNVSSK